MATNEIQISIGELHVHIYYLHIAYVLKYLQYYCTVLLLNKFIHVIKIAKQWTNFTGQKVTN